MNQTNKPSTPSTEKVSTAMQELIEDVKANMMGSIVALQESGLTEKERSHYNATIIVAKDVIAKAQSLLPKETQRIIDDFDNGQANWEEGVRDYKNGLDYFNKTFKQ